MERARRRRLTPWIQAAIALAIIATLVVAHLLHRPPVPREVLSIPGDTGARVTAEVLNATGEDGLARDVTSLLRQRGIDVVSFGSAGGPSLDSTVILVRRGDSTAGVRVRRALGTGRVRLAPDPSLLLDVSVLAGADLRAAIKLHP